MLIPNNMKIVFGVYSDSMCDHFLNLVERVKGQHGKLCFLTKLITMTIAANWKMSKLRSVCLLRFEDFIRMNSCCTFTYKSHLLHNEFNLDRSTFVWMACNDI